MRAPLGWLRACVDVDPAATGAQVAAALVRVGLEEEGLHGGGTTGPVVVARITTAEREPQKNGKTISWCTVDAGEGAPRGIVCGAPNAVAGALVVAALPGAVLPGPFPIAARRTYGHTSDGMLCSARELGLGDEHDGIIDLERLLGPGSAALAAARPGDDALALLGLAEEVVEVNVTPDRGYCFSVRGLAREYAHGARLDVATAFHDPADVPVPDPAPGGVPVLLADGAPLAGVPGCTRLVTRVVRGLDPAAPSPFWLRRRLQQAGMRPVSLAVDVTNHVMLEVGQPLHAYDLASLDVVLDGDPGGGGARGLVVRRARPGERLVTLDGADRALHPEDLVIADGAPDADGPGPRAVGLAGTMGGRATEVGPATTDVVIEAARFDPVTVARSARRHKLPSEASRRFERGVDTALQAAAAELAVRLLVEHGGGTADPGVTDARAGVGEGGADGGPAPVELALDLPARLSGLDLDADRVIALLRQVGCTTAPAGGGSVLVTPPTWRPDITQAVDLVEEVVRLAGYADLPSTTPSAPAGPGLTAAQRGRRAVADALAAAGLVEVACYPFTSTARADALGLPADDPQRRAVRLANPLSEQAPLMRTTVLATLVDAAARNTARGAADVAVYEVARVTAPAPPGPAPVPSAERRPSDAELAAVVAAVPDQPVHVAAVMTGRAEAAGWWGPGRAWDAADAVAAARTAARAVRVELTATGVAGTGGSGGGSGGGTGGAAPWHPGRCAALALPDGTPVGRAGELHPAVVTALGLPARAVAFELDLDAVLAAAPEVVPAPRLSPYPPAKEDVALVVDAAVPAEAVRAALVAGAAAAGHGPLVEDVRLFDVYTGAQVPDGHRSLAFALRLRAPDRTLTAAEVAAVREAALAEAAARTGAVLRAL